MNTWVWSSSQCCSVELARVYFYWEKLKETQPKQGQEVTLYMTSVKFIIGYAYPPVSVVTSSPHSEFASCFFTGLNW